MTTLHSFGDNDNASSKAEPELSPKKRAALRKSWAQLIKRVYQTDPLKCECGGTLRVIGFITEHKVIRKILDHLDKRNGNSRAPPKTLTADFDTPFCRDAGTKRHSFVFSPPHNSM